MRRPVSASNARAFTLVELLVTIAIVSVVLSLLLPALKAVRDRAREATCLSNARQLVVTINAFAATNGSRLPEARTLDTPTTYRTWRRRFFDLGLLSEAEVWACPLHPDSGPWGEAGLVEGGAKCTGDFASSYALNGHVLWKREKTGQSADLAATSIQRPSHTILLAETNRFRADLRVSPPLVANYFGDTPGPYSYWHSGGGVYAFLDGHAEIVRFMDTGSPNCRWHNGRDLTDDLWVPQKPSEIRTHDHPDWKYLVPEIYLQNRNPDDF
ncbi:MAG: type II secretion system protein [Planctomycetota bacterium]